MSKQGKGLAGFGAVASKTSDLVNEDKAAEEGENQDRNDKSESSRNQNDNRNAHITLSNSVGEILHSVTKKPKPTVKRQISAYIDEDVAKKLDKFGKEHGKGAKSELINNFLKSVL